MAHNLNFNNGKASLFYTGEVPWHHLGTKLDAPATAHEAIKAAQLDYQVEKKPLRAIVHPTRHSPVEDQFATVRMDTREVLGIVGRRYSPIQNRDAFAFFDSLIGSDEAIYHTAGALGKGEQIWILAKLPGYIKVRGEDIVEKYLLLTNSHDGSSLVRAKLTPIRVVCNNTLTAALDGVEEEVRNTLRSQMLYPIELRARKRFPSSISLAHKEMDNKEPTNINVANKYRSQS